MTAAAERAPSSTRAAFVTVHAPVDVAGVPRASRRRPAEATRSPAAPTPAASARARMLRYTASRERARRRYQLRPTRVLVAASLSGNDGNNGGDDRSNVQQELQQRTAQVAAAVQQGAEETKERASGEAQRLSREAGAYADSFLARARRALSRASLSLRRNWPWLRVYLFEYAVFALALGARMLALIAASLLSPLLFIVARMLRRVVMIKQQQQQWLPQSVMVTGASPGGVGEAVALEYCRRAAREDAPLRLYLVDPDDSVALEPLCAKCAELYPGAEVATKSADGLDTPAMRDVFRAVDDSCGERGLDTLVVTMPAAAASRKAMMEGLRRQQQQQQESMPTAFAQFMAASAANESSSSSSPSSEQSRSLFDAEVSGTLNAVWPAVDAFAKRGRGRIAIVTSETTENGNGSDMAHAAAHAALRSYGESLRHELARSGVKVNTVVLGPRPVGADDSSSTGAESSGAQQAEPTTAAQYAAAARHVVTKLIYDEPLISYPAWIGALSGAVSSLPVLVKEAFVVLRGGSGSGSGDDAAGKRENLQRSW